MKEELNLRNPFAAFNASLMGDDDVLKYWIQPEIVFGVQAMGIDLTGDTPVIFEGGRGTGKTMLLKWMSNEIKIKEYVSENSDGKGFLNQTLYVGIYHRFDGPSLASFDSRHTSPEGWETLFKHYFELTIGQKMIMLWQNLKENQCIDIEKSKEIKILTEILKLVDESIIIQEEPSLDFAIDFFQRELERIFDFINCAALSTETTFSGHPIRSGKLIFGIPEILQENLPEFHGKRIILLLDEYENLQYQQQKIINTLFKHTKNFVTFRIGTRLKGFKTCDTLNVGEFLMEDADYRRIRFEDVLMSHNEEYRNLLKMIAKRRLEHIPELQEKGFTDIESILGEFPVEDEATIIVFNKKLTQNEIDQYPLDQYLKTKHVVEIGKVLNKKHRLDESLDAIFNSLIDKKPLLEMLNLLLLRRNYEPEVIAKMFASYISGKRESLEFKKYANLYDKNKLSLLFQLVSLNKPTQKQYAGFNVYCMLSSGIIRNFLELCYQSFNIALFSDRTSLIKDGKMSFEAQTDGATIRAERYMDMIERIPEWGNEIKSLVKQLGAIFYSWQNDPVLSEPEVTYFCVDNEALSEKARKVLNCAVQWSVLQPKKAMKGKATTDPLINVYVLNHILAPYFSISYRLRGRIRQFSKEDLETLIFGTEREKEVTRNRLSRESRINLSLNASIMDFVGE